MDKHMPDNGITDNDMPDNLGSLPEYCEVAIIGSGPAGLATAIELKRLGVSDIIMLERSETAGGNPRHCGHSPFGIKEFKRVYLGPAYAKKMLATALQLGVKVATATTVTSIEKDGLLTLSTLHGITQLQAKRVVLTTGIREQPRSARFISGQRPAGITTTGALQSMVYLSHKKPFKRPVIIGTELVSFSAIASCYHAGIKPVAMIDPNNRITALSLLQIMPRVLGIKLLLNAEILDITGKQQVSGINIVNGAGKTEHIKCDGIIFSGNFTPEASLARMGHLDIDPKTQGPVIDQFGRCSDPCYFAAGNVLRPVETAGWCWKEGVQTARFVQHSLAKQLPDTDNQLTFQVKSDKIKYIVPQKFSIAHEPPKSQGIDNIQLRFSCAVKGKISIHSENNTELYTENINILPERRVLLPMTSIRNNQKAQEITFNFIEKS